MSPEQLARCEALWEQLHKLGGVPAGHGKIDVLLEALHPEQKGGFYREFEADRCPACGSPLEGEPECCPDCGLNPAG